MSLSRICFFLGSKAVISIMVEIENALNCQSCISYTEIQESESR